MFQKPTAKKTWSISGVPTLHKMKRKGKEKRGKLAEYWECPHYVHFGDCLSPVDVMLRLFIYLFILSLMFSITELILFIIDKFAIIHRR